MNIAVCDDETIIREQIKGLIEKQEERSHVEVYETGDEMLTAGKHYDVVFLDIQMEGRNGIETARMIRKREESTILIFITGVKEYVFEAFDVAAFHYLLKPIQEAKFTEVFKRAVKEAERNLETKQKLFIKTKNASLTLNHKDILFVESRGRKVEIHTKGKVVETYAVMAELESQLGSGFYRCHRGYLVNMAHIAEYENDSISLSNGENIFMAKERYNEFVKEYMRYLRNGGTACV